MSMKGSAEGYGYSMRVPLSDLEMLGYRRPLSFSMNDVIRDADGAPVDPTRHRDEVWRAPPLGAYTGPNRKFGDYYVREVRRSGSQRRSVYLEVVGTGRVIRVGRKAFERVLRNA